MDKNPVTGHFERWLRAGMTGCSYAQRLARMPGGTAIHSITAADFVDDVGSIFDACGAQHRAAIIVFPQVRDEAGLVALLHGLARDSPRWRLRSREAEGTVHLGLDWITAAGDVSDTMGFAPFASMPVPRRAPYVAIGAWPGGRDNPFRDTPPTPPSRAGQVSFLDAAHDLELGSYGRAWTTTTATIAGLMQSPPDDARRYRKTAFVLGAGASEPISATASPP